MSDQRLVEARVKINELYRQTEVLSEMIADLKAENAHLRAIRDAYFEQSSLMMDLLNMNERGEIKEES